MGEFVREQGAEAPLDTDGDLFLEAAGGADWAQAIVNARKAATQGADGLEMSGAEPAEGSQENTR